MAYEHIAYDVADRIATVTLNRPDKLNAYTATMGAELAEAFVAADADDEVRVVIVTGAGRGFCAGADISGGANAFDSRKGDATMFAPASSSEAAGRRPASSGEAAGRRPASSGEAVGQRPASNSEAIGQRPASNSEAIGQRRTGFIGAIYNCRKPSIAAINGPAVGVGITLALPMDIRIASRTAKIGFVFARRGLVPEAGSAWFLPRLVGLDQALRWCLSGRVFDAQEALAGGLVSEVLAPDDLLPRARAIAAEMVENTAPVSVALTRHMLWQYSGLPDPFAVMAIDGALSVELGAGGDVKEGVASFLEKRKPAFPGKVSQGWPESYKPAPR